MGRGSSQRLAANGPTVEDQRIVGDSIRASISQKSCFHGRLKRCGNPQGSSTVFHPHVLALPPSADPSLLFLVISARSRLQVTYALAPTHTLVCTPSAMQYIGMGSASSCRRSLSGCRATWHALPSWRSRPFVNALQALQQQMQQQADVAGPAHEQ